MNSASGCACGPLYTPTAPLLPASMFRSSKSRSVLACLLFPVGVSWVATHTRSVCCSPVLSRDCYTDCIGTAVGMSVRRRQRAEMVGIVSQAARVLTILAVARCLGESSLRCHAPKKCRERGSVVNYGRTSK